MSDTFKLLLSIVAACFFSPRGVIAQDLRFITPPTPEKARIIFIRAKQGLGSDVGADVLEVVNDKPQFVGQLWQGEKLLFETTPGPKKFLTLGYAPTPTQGYTLTGDILFAELTGGKTYYVVLRFRPGSGGIIPTPVRASGQFQQESKLVVAGITGYRLIPEDPTARERYTRERDSDRVQKEYERVSRLFEGKSASQLAERTLRSEDAVK